MRLKYNSSEYARLLRRLPPPENRRAIRIESGLSMQQVADELGVTSTAVRLWEVGERRPSAEVLRRYVELLEGLRSIAAEVPQ